MDIKSIIDSEDAPAPKKPSASVAAKQEYRTIQNGPYTQVPSYENHHDIRQPQSSPTRISLQNGHHSQSAASPDTYQPPYQPPYQRTSSFEVNRAHHPPGQVSIQVPQLSHQHPQFFQREVSSASGIPQGYSIGQHTPTSHTPTASTPGSASAYSNFPRPTSSHSIPTPTSTQHPTNYLRESPQPQYSQTRTFPQSQGSQPYVSQPGTPLGPPSTHGRSSLNHQRESPVLYDHRRSHSGGPQDRHQSVARSKTALGTPTGSADHDFNMSREREKSVSISPKTRLTSLPNMHSNIVASPAEFAVGGWSRPGSNSEREFVSDTPGFGRSSESRSIRTPSRSVGVTGLLNAEPSNEGFESNHRSSQTMSPSDKGDENVDVEPHGNMEDRHRSNFTTSIMSPTEQRTSTHHPSTPHQTSVSSDHGESTPHSLPESSGRSDMVSSFKLQALKGSSALKDSPHPPSQSSSRGSKKTKRKSDHPIEDEVTENGSVTSSQPAPKKPRLVEPNDRQVNTIMEVPEETLAEKRNPRISDWRNVPIFARSIRGDERTKVLFERNLRGLAKSSSQIYPPPVANGSLSRPSSTTQSVPQHPTTNGVHRATGEAVPTIIDTIPAEDVTRIVSDFLFEHAVIRDDVGVAPAGGGRGLGAVIEIEAKIGQLIDYNTKDRLQLPVSNECVLNQDYTRQNVMFKSSMTEVSRIPTRPDVFSLLILCRANIAHSTNFLTKL